MNIFSHVGQVDRLERTKTLSKFYVSLGKSALLLE